MHKRPPEYSIHFRSAEIAGAYERGYTGGTADEALWSIEREFLHNLFSANEEQWPFCTYLDFACGTGRVIAFMEERPAQSTGVDISPEMLAIAQAKTRRSKLICGDITDEAVASGPYDLITAFRFFLNAEPELRLAVMNALALRLRDQRSRLVISNHGNPLSYKAIAWPIHRLRQKIGGRGPSGNYLTDREVRQLASQCGLQILERSGCGLVSPRLFKLAPHLLRSVERWFRNGSLATAIGVNQLYVLAKQ